MAAGEIHLYPTGETGHDLVDGDDCLCDPEIRELEDGGVVVQHRADEGYDGTWTLTAHRTVMRPQG